MSVGGGRLPSGIDAGLAPTPRVSVCVGGVLTRREVGRLSKGTACLRAGASRDRARAAEELATSLMAFFGGEAEPFVSFRVADFRDDTRRVLLVVEQSC